MRDEAVDRGRGPAAHALRGAVPPEGPGVLAAPASATPAPATRTEATPAGPRRIDAIPGRAVDREESPPDIDTVLDRVSPP